MSSPHFTAKLPNLYTSKCYISLHYKWKLTVKVFGGLLPSCFGATIEAPDIEAK